MDPSTTETKPLPSEPVVTSGDDIAASVAAGMPTPTEGILSNPSPESQTNSAPPPPASSYTGQVDSEGTQFDPNRHKVDAEGKPRLNAKGRFMGFKASFQPSQAQQQAAAPRTILPGEKPPADLPDKFLLAARAYCKGAEGGLCALVSDEWKFDDQAEEDWVVAAVTEYLRSTGETNLSPGTLAILVGLAYAGKRIQRPKTANKLAGLWFKVKGWFGSSKTV